MKWSINAGRIFGIKLRIHVTFFLLLLYVFFSDIKEGFGQAGLSVLFVCAIFACVVIHELSHSLVARRFGREPKSITLLPIGGVADNRYDADQAVAGNSDINRRPGHQYRDSDICLPWLAARQWLPLLIITPI